jgi:hypothetical protein
MKLMSHLARAALTITAVALLAACGGSQPPVGAPGAMGQTTAIASSADPGKSWMLPEARTTDELLYVSDGNAQPSGYGVWVLAYPSGKYLGAFTGFDEPMGLCVGKKGDVFIAEFNASLLVEYSHGGTSPIQTFSTNGNPEGCSVSPSGDIAVANYTKSGPGNIQVFVSAKKAKSYSNKACSSLYWPPGYDDKGNLYVEVFTDSIPGVCEVSARSGKLRPVSVSQTIHHPGSVMWDGKYITLADQDYDSEGTTAIYEATESPSGDLTVVHSTVLTNYGAADVYQPFIVTKENTPVAHEQGKRVVGGDLDRHSEVDYWMYPAGGNPHKALQMYAVPPTPVGAAVSIAK